MRTVSGSPRLGTIDDLLAQTVVLRRARRLGRKRENRFLVGGALFEPHALCDYRFEYLAAEHLVDLRSDVARQRGPLVVHGDDDAQDPQAGIRARADLLNGF